MTKRWTLWAQLAYPLSDSDKALMILNCDYEYKAVNQAQGKKVKSPAAQFDESHAKWVKNGREC